MSKPENRFIAGVHKHLPPEKELHREKMNNPYRSGTADMWYSGDLADLWAEYKYLPSMPTRAPLRLMTGKKDSPITALQADWLRRRYREGRAVCVVVGCPKGGVMMWRLEWEREWTPEDFRARLVSRAVLARTIFTLTQGLP